MRLAMRNFESAPLSSRALVTARSSASMLIMTSASSVSVNVDTSRTPSGADTGLRFHAATLWAAVASSAIAVPCDQDR
jgi:hypothetical protein